MSLRDVGVVKDATEVTLVHPVSRAPLHNADGTPMTITVCGPYSARYKALVREQQQKRIAELAKSGATPATLTPEEVELFSEELLIRSVIDWRITVEGDELLPFSEESVRSVFDEFPWVRPQIEAVIGNIAAFLEAPKNG